MKLLYKLATIAALCAPLTFAPLTYAQDTSGNSLLKGGYRFRYVAPVNYGANGAISEVVAAEGEIDFDGEGNYTIAQGSTYIDNTLNSGKPNEFPTGAGGTYAISAAGIGYIQNPLGSTSAYSELDEVAEFGTVSGDIFTGSATESYGETEGEIALNDLFVVMLVGTPTTNSTFTSSYWLGVLDFSGGTDQLLKNALVEINPNGSGGFGALTVTGLTSNYQPGTLLTQTVSGATYSFAADGGATLTLPLPSGVTTADAMFTGSRLMYVSSDGNYVLGWNPNGYDIFFGVKALTAPPTDSLFKGLYYTGNLSDEPLVVKSETIVQGCGAESFWGSENAYGNESGVIHQRWLSQYCSATSAVTDLGEDDYQLSAIGSDGTFTDALGNYYAVGASGNAFVSVSNTINAGCTPACPYFSLTIGIHAPSFCGASGLCLNPIGVVNAASWDPVTAALAPGELITLYGTGLSSSTLANVGGSPFGTSLGTTQVLVNGQPAPILDISPFKVDAIIPYEVDIANGYAELQVNNGGLLSNQVQVYLTDANSGIFAVSELGIGDAVAEHASGAYVNPDSPAQPGETIVLALTGMGTVTPTITDGAVGPSSPLSYADVYTNATGCTTTTPNCNLLVLFNDYVNGSIQQQATVTYAGLYPGLAGLYQMNVTVPATVGPGEVYIEVITDAADVEQVTVCVTSCSSGNSAASKAQLRPALGSPTHPLKLPKARLHTTGTIGLRPTARPGLR
jgi:uncharacterized protein (TIGR03437 family)